MSRGGQRTQSGGHHPYTPPARTLEDDRYLLNWLSTRVIPNALADGYECHPDSSYEQKLVENRIAYAHALGLTIQPGTYIAPGALKHMPRQLRYEDFLRQRAQRLQQKRAS